MSLIRPKIPIASGVIDLSGSEDLFTNLLSLRTKQILAHHTFHNDEFPEQINMMIDDFVSTYRDLGLISIRYSYDQSLSHKGNYPLNPDVY